MTDTEAIAKYLWNRRGEWIASHALEKANLDGHWVGTSGTRRARELAETGYFESANWKYYIERKKIGQYAHYRITERTPRYEYARTQALFG
jgi:hypothetical protein